MNYDFLKLTSYAVNDTSLLEGLTKVNDNFEWRCSTYSLTGMKDIKFVHSWEKSILRLEGSIPYFISGQNFTPTIVDVKNGLHDISHATNIDWFNAEVNCFEFGTTFPIPYKPNIIFSTHTELAGYKLDAKTYGNYFKSKISDLKLYDAGKRLKQMLSTKDRQILANGSAYRPNLNYLRVENHCYNPLKYLDKNRLLASDLFKEAEVDKIKKDLFVKYTQIKQMANYVTPTEKTQLQTPHLLLMLIMELSQEAGIDYKQALLALPDRFRGILSPEERKYRKKALKKVIRAIPEQQQKTYDIGEELKQSLFIGN